MYRLIAIDYIYRLILIRDKEVIQSRGELLSMNSKANKPRQ